MTALRNGLYIGLLFIACIVGLQVTFLLSEAGQLLEDAGASATSLLSGAGAAVMSANEAIGLAKSTLMIQQGYYRDSASHIKALTRAAAIDAVQLGRFIEHTDAHVESLTASARGTLDSARDAATVFAKQTQTIGEESGALLEAGTEATKSAGELAGDPSLKQSLANLEATTGNLQTTTAAASQAMASIRDMLSPTKKSFWRRLLEMMIPRPTVRIP